MKSLLAALAVGGLLVALSPAAAHAQAIPPFPSWGGGIGVGVPSAGLGASPCGTAVAGGQGSPAAPAVCTSGLSFVGPTIGQIAVVMGPTIISPAVINPTIIVASGSNVVAPGAGGY
ncbi:MAG TPA: hypothetical protein VI318_01700 [Baekduia sp.]